MAPPGPPWIRQWLLPSEEDRNAATDNMYKKLVKFGRVFRDMSVDRRTYKQTDRQTDTLIAILCILYRGRDCIGGNGGRSQRL